MKKNILFTLLFALLTIAVFAGNKKTTAVRGHVIDSDGSPIVGAKVSIKGLNTSVYTDFDGAFYFKKVDRSFSTLLVSMVSFEVKESTINLENNTSTPEVSITLKSK